MGLVVGSTCYDSEGSQSKMRTFPVRTKEARSKFSWRTVSEVPFETDVQILRFLG